ncbi:hypothetical protein [Longimicrobium sp.]|uniref:hypothetical protein n=1 Tax=Longimicrobium sp. TaxID=2029185 RepID=UPI003B3AFF65
MADSAHRTDFATHSLVLTVTKIDLYCNIIIGRGFINRSQPCCSINKALGTFTDLSGYGVSVPERALNFFKGMLHCAFAHVEVAANCPFTCGYATLL